MTSKNYMLERQFNITQQNLTEDSLIFDSINEMYTLMKMFYNYLEGKKPMDKQINKVKKAVVKGEKSVAKKEISKLMKMDKRQDKKVAMCAKKMPMKKSVAKKKSK